MPSRGQHTSRTPSAFLGQKKESLMSEATLLVRLRRLAVRAMMCVQPARRVHMAGVPLGRWHEEGPLSDNTVNIYTGWSIWSDSWVELTLI